MEGYVTEEKKCETEVRRKDCREKKSRTGKSREKDAEWTAERQLGWQRTEEREKRQEGREMAGQTQSNPEEKAGP